MIKVKRKNMKLQNISTAIPVGKESTVITYLIIIFVNLWKSRSQFKTSCRCKLQIQLNNLSRVLYKRVANHFTHILAKVIHPKLYKKDDYALANTIVYALVYFDTKKYTLKQKLAIFTLLCFINFATMNRNFFLPMET